MHKFTNANLSPSEAYAALEEIIPQMLPDPLSVWDFASSDTIFAQTTTGRLFMITATDDGAFEVIELDASRFGIHEGEDEIK